MENASLINELFLPGKSVQIELVNERRLIKAVLIRSAAEDELTLLLSQNDPAIDYLPLGSKLNLVCWNEADSHEYHFITDYLKIKPGELPRLVVKRPVAINYSSRRGCFRCDVNLPFSYFYDLNEKKGEVCNLSASGLLAKIEFDSLLKLGHRLTCKLILPDSKRPLFFVGTIVRIIPDGLEQSLALSFQDPTQEVQDQINRYLFHRQRQLININKQKPSKLLDVSQI